jgi:hypothetical protein
VFTGRGCPDANGRGQVWRRTEGSRSEGEGALCGKTMPPAAADDAQWTARTGECWWPGGEGAKVDAAVARLTGVVAVEDA